MAGTSAGHDGARYMIGSAMTIESSMKMVSGPLRSIEDPALAGLLPRDAQADLKPVAPNYAAHSAYWSNYVQPGQSPLIAFLVFELIGVVIGGFISGWLAGRIRLAVDKGPRISRRSQDSREIDNSYWREP